MNATSSPASELLVLSAFIYRNSITFLHSSRWSFSNSVERIVLSSQQVNETSLQPVAYVAHRHWFGVVLAP
jgi:putative flippase GtrA